MQLSLLLPARSEMKAEINNKTDGFRELMTEDELIEFLRIPEITKAKNHHWVIENLKRMHGLPCIHICKKPLYPLNAVLRWIEDKLLMEMK